MRETQRGVDLVCSAHVRVLLLIFACSTDSCALPVRAGVLRCWRSRGRGWGGGSVQSAHAISIVVGKRGGWEGGAGWSETTLRVSTKHIIRGHNVGRHRLHRHHSIDRRLGYSSRRRSRHFILDRGEQELAVIVSTLAHHLGTCQYIVRWH